MSAVPAEEIKPGIYLDLDETIYHGIPALSNSGMKDLAVSDLAYWDAHLAPDREAEEQKDCWDFGKAAHCRLLEHGRFQDLYAKELTEEDVPGALVTNDDLKLWLVNNKLKVGGKKQELIERILESGLPHPPIWEIAKAEYAVENVGKRMVSQEHLNTVEIMAALVAADPYAKQLCVGGMPEVSFIVREPETGVLLKARMDYVKPSATIDVKTFTNSRRKNIDKTVDDAMYWEGYYKQAVIYHKIRELARRQVLAGEIAIHGDCTEEWHDGFLKTEHHGIGFLFLESVRPYHVAIRELREREAPGADMNLYWNAPQIYMAAMIERYAEAFRKYGDRPWREAAKPKVMTDADFPQLMFAA